MISAFLTPLLRRYFHGQSMDLYQTGYHGSASLTFLDIRVQMRSLEKLLTILVVTPTHVNFFFFLFVCGCSLRVYNPTHIQDSSRSLIKIWLFILNHHQEYMHAFFGYQKRLSSNQPKILIRRPTLVVILYSCYNLKTEP